MAAIELLSGNCGADPMSPRISFSHDFSHSSVIPVEQHPLRSNSSGFSNPPSIDFDFCVRESFDHESSSADELFSHGRIIPTQLKKNKSKSNSKYNHPPLKQPDQFLLPSPPPPSHPHPHPQAVRENASTTRTASKKELRKCVNQNEEADHNHKSFWGFKRSSSCGSGYGRSLCPLPLLSRSYSTGSTTSSGKRNLNPSKEGKNAQKLHASSSARSSSSSFQYSFATNTYQKPPLKKCHGSYGNIGGVRGVNPVILNVPSANLFGFGSIFSKNRDKNKRK